MGDISTETSMEDILSSIKRIIAEEGEGAPIRNRRESRSEERNLDPSDTILELRETVDGPVDQPLSADEAEDDEKDSEPMSYPDSTDGNASEQDDDHILSKHVAAASRQRLESLSRLIVKPGAAGPDTLEGLVREMLRPMLREWLDANLPDIVDRMVAREIARITDRDD